MKTPVTSVQQLLDMVRLLHHGSDGKEHNKTLYMFRVFSRTHYLAGLWNLLKEYCATCEGCQSRGHTAGKHRVVSMPIKSTRPLQHMQLDLSLHPADTVSGARYTAALKDCFTGFLWAEKFLTKEAEAIATW
eukprot:546995-Prorocentrum_minimum.AAC.1